MGHILLNLFEVVAESNLDTILLPQHLTGHQGVENGGNSQRQAEIDTEEPPVLCCFIKLHRDKSKNSSWLMQNICTGEHEYEVKRQSDWVQLIPSLVWTGVRGSRECLQIRQLGFYLNSICTLLQWNLSCMCVCISRQDFDKAITLVFKCTLAPL